MTTEKKPRLAAYFRTSSSGQEREETIVRQYDSFARWWDHHSDQYELVTRFPKPRSKDPAQIHFADPGYNLEEWDSTKAFHELMSRAQKREVEVIWTTEIDRISRSRSNEFRGKILDIFQRADTRILTRNGEVPPGILLSLLSSIGAEDKRAIMFKCQEGKITRLERDGRPPSGKIPFGYNFNKRTNIWTVVDDEAVAIRSVASLMTGKLLPDLPPMIQAMVQAHPTGLTAAEIVGILNSAGFSLLKYYDRNNYSKWLKKNPTGHIREGFIDNLVRDDRYRGSYSIFLRDPKQVGHPDCKGMAREKKKEFKIKLPPILTNEIWEKMEEARAGRAMNSRRNVQHDYLLKDLLTCDECGISLSARPKWKARKDGVEKPTLYYVCTRKQKVSGFRCKANRCHSSPALDALIFSEVRSVVLSDDTLLALQPTDTSLVPTASISQFEWLLEEQQKHLKGLGEQRAKNITSLNKDLISEEDFKNEKSRIEDEIKAGTKTAEKLERKIRALQSANEKRPEVDLKKIRKNIGPKIDELTFEHRRQLVTTLVHQVRIKPTGEFKILLRPISAGPKKALGNESVAAACVE